MTDSCIGKSIFHPSETAIISVEHFLCTVVAIYEKLTRYTVKNQMKFKGKLQRQMGKFISYGYNMNYETRKYFVL